MIAVSFPYSIQLNRITIILLVANWIFEGDYRRKWDIVKDNVVLILLIAFYLLYGVALLYTTNMAAGLSELEKKSSYLAFSVLVVSTTPPLTKRELNIVLKAFMLSVVVVSLICLGYAVHRNNYLDTFTHPYWFYFSYNDLTEIVGLQPNYLAIFTGFAIMIAYYFVIEHGSAYSKSKKIMIYALIVYLAVFLVLLAGRTPLFATLFIVAIGYLFYFHKTGRLVRGFVAIVILVVAMGVLVFQVPIMRERLLQTFGIEQQTEWINQMGDGKGGLPSVRLMKWQSSWNVIRDNWLIGISPGDTQDALQEQYKQMDFTIAFEEQFNPHNQYLQVWIGVGLIGLFVFLATLLIPLRRAIQSSDYLYISFLALFAMCCITESVLERQFGIIFYAMFNALFLQRQSSYSRGHESVNS